jgi:hypothetical protein
MSRGFNNRESCVSNCSTDSDATSQSPRFTHNIRKSSILSDDMGLYSEPDYSPSLTPRRLFYANTRRWSVAMPGGSQEDVIEEEDERDVNVGPEVRGE